jgi:hypothetical protein
VGPAIETASVEAIKELVELGAVHPHSSRIPLAILLED